MRPAVLLALLAAVATLGFAACGGDDSGPTTAATEDTAPGVTTITIEGMDTVPEGMEVATTATEPTLVGNAAAGKQVFLSTGCGTCHTLRAAGSTGTIGPNLDQRLVTDTAESDGDLTFHVRDAIENPDALISPGGYLAGTMPGTYADQLSDQQLADLVAFVVDAVQ